MKTKEETVTINPDKVDQAKVLETVLKEIPYEFTHQILIKPLPVEKITIKQSVPDEKSKKKDGTYSKMKEEVREVDSMYNKGIILKLPIGYDQQELPEADRRKAGDVVVYQRRDAKPFDLYRDSVLIRSFEIVATIPTKKE